MANNWMNNMMSPSKKAIMGYLSGQQKGLKNEIGALHKQYVGMGQGPVAKGLSGLIGVLPSAEGIGRAYSQANAGLGQMLSDYNTDQGGKDVSGIVSAMGAGIGAAPGVTADAAQAAGTLSGVGSWGGNVADKALLMGVGAKFAGDQAQALSDAANQKMTLEQGLWQAQGSQQDKKSALAAQIAGLKDKQAGVKMNPLDVANMLMKFGLNKQAYNKAMSDKSVKSSKTTSTVTPTPLTPSTGAWGQPVK